MYNKLMVHICPQKVPILTASPEELLQVSRSRTYNPSISQLTGKYWRQATLTVLGTMHNTIDHMVGVEYASYMMVPSTTNKTRYHGLSQNHMNEQSGFKAENGYISESKIKASTHTR
jgi:hypothetical protein